MVSLKDREYWIDAVRSFACLCVLTTHAPIPSTTGGRIFVPVFNFLAVGGASILFFMISGALVLYKRQYFHIFIKKRISRIFLPMVIWSVISLIVRCLVHRMEWGNLPKKVLLIPFQPQVSTYWFIYVIFGIYLLTPVLSTWLANTDKKEVKAMLYIWGCTLLLPFFPKKYMPFILTFDHSYLYYFYGYLGFALLGYYLRRYVDFHHVSWRLIAAPFCIFFCVMAIYPTYLVPHAVLQNRLALPAALMAICYFLILKHLSLSATMKKVVYEFARHSFGIYLVHSLVMRQFLWPIFRPFQINHLIAIPLLTILTAIISYLLVWTIGKIVPYSKYIVGV